MRFNVEKMPITFAKLCFLLMVVVVKRLVYCKEITVNTDGNDTEDCLEGDYPCSSLGYVLNHLQSNDCVNITSNPVPLTTIVELHSLNAITIIGQVNTIVTCNSTGGVSCNNCSNVVIEGITWDGCGDPTAQNSTGGITFTSVTNASIINCILQNSKVCALHLHMVAGIINITGTQVINNANYDTVFCVDGQSGPHCFTSMHGSSGGLYIEESSEEAGVYISNCTFKRNGQFGNVYNLDIKDIENYASVDCAAIKVVHSNNTIVMRVTIEHTSFFSNRGNDGGAVIINTYNSPTITLYNIDFVNNSVVASSVNSSALMLQLNSPSPTPVLNMSFCNFTNNSDGRNVISFITTGQPVHLVVMSCNFIDNRRYDIALLEINMQSQSVASLVSLNFFNNTGSALLYLHLCHADVGVSLYNVQAIGNYGTSTFRRGGLLTFRVFENFCVVNITKLTFIKNKFARDGGGLDINGVFHESFKFSIQDSHFINNIGGNSGTVIYALLTSDHAFLFTIYSSSFVGNSGGSSIARIRKRSLGVIGNHRPGLLLMGKSTVFLHNFGGALTVTEVLVIGNGKTTFDSNTDNNGAALFLGNSFILLDFIPFQFYFIHNFAFRRGGAIYIEFPTNLNVAKCNWLMHLDRNEVCNGDIQGPVGCPVIDSDLLCDEILPEVVEDQQSCSFAFNLNSAAASGNAIFYDVSTLPAIENSSDPNSIFYLPESTFCFMSNQTTDLSTQPFKVRLKEPAKCNDMDCITYYITDIMLGEEIEIPAQIVGYNNRSAESTVFFVTCEENCTTSNGSTNYMITGTIPILISDKFGGIKITGIQNGPPLKLHLFSVSLQFDLVVELISCRSGYTYNKVAMQCECYTTDGIVSCTPEPTIKRDYWFGMVDNTTTVSRCPYTYCNFRRREISPGRFVLPSVQDNQCDSHRTGPACGSCDDGYTIPFDSVECINVDDCHPGYTVLAIIGVMAYWVIVIVATFFLMLWLHHIRCNIGYLYGIVYYYSVVDILLGQIASRSNGLSSLLPIFGGSLFKLYPGFLFRVCFVQGMDAIDQYVIHFAHPTAVLLLVWLLSKIAVRSQKFASIIGKAAIPTICLIVTLAYVSIADASLQLLRSLQFNDLDGSYVYLSPAIEYFTGRHIAYVILAAFFELIVGFALPLLLLVEPFINHKIDFTKIKPLLDQFQGCYKDRFRWLASVYLIGRQMILIITVIDFSNPYIEQYLLMIVCVIIVLLHYLFQPYNVDTLNKYDGILLHILLLIASLKIVAFSNGFTTDGIVGLTYVLYFFPFVVSLIFLLHYIHVITLKNKQTKTERSESISLESSRNLTSQISYIETFPHDLEDDDRDTSSRRSSFYTHYRDSFIAPMERL